MASAPLMSIWTPCLAQPGHRSSGSIPKRRCSELYCRARLCAAAAAADRVSAGSAQGERSAPVEGAAQPAQQQQQRRHGARPARSRTGDARSRPARCSGAACSARASGAGRWSGARRSGARRRVGRGGMGRCGWGEQGALASNMRARWAQGPFQVTDTNTTQDCFFSAAPFLQHGVPPHPPLALQARQGRPPQQHQHSCTPGTRQGAALPGRREAPQRRGGAAQQQKDAHLTRSSKSSGVRVTTESRTAGMGTGASTNVPAPGNAGKA